MEIWRSKGIHFFFSFILPSWVSNNRLCEKLSRTFFPDANLTWKNYYEVLSDNRCTTELFSKLCKQPKCSLAKFFENKIKSTTKNEEYKVPLFQNRPNTDEMSSGTLQWANPMLACGDLVVWLDLAEHVFFWPTSFHFNFFLRHTQRLLLLFSTNDFASGRPMYRHNFQSSSPVPLCNDRTLCPCIAFEYGTSPRGFAQMHWNV